MNQVTSWKTGNVFHVQVGEEVGKVDPVPCALIEVRKEANQAILECFQPSRDGVAKTSVASLTLKMRGERQSIAPHNFNLSLVPSDRRPEVYGLINEYLYGELN